MKGNDPGNTSVNLRHGLSAQLPCSGQLKGDIFYENLTLFELALAGRAVKFAVKFVLLVKDNACVNTSQPKDAHWL